METFELWQRSFWNYYFINFCFGWVYWREWSLDRFERKTQPCKGFVCEGFVFLKWDHYLLALNSTFYMLNCFDTGHFEVKGAFMYIVFIQNVICCLESIVFWGVGRHFGNSPASSRQVWSAFYGFFTCYIWVLAGCLWLSVEKLH